MVSLPVVPTYYDENVGPDAEFEVFLKNLCSEIGLAYNSKECQRVAVFTQPQPKGSIYTRGLYPWRRDEAGDLQRAAQKMAGDGYIVKIEKAGPDTRTPAQKAWDNFGWPIVIGAIVFAFFAICCIGCCVAGCWPSSQKRAAKKAKKARKQREKEERRERKAGYLRKKSRTSTIEDVELGNIGQVLI